MGGVAVVTDSTADLPADLAEQLDLRVVPLTVRFGDDEYQSRITISDEQFYARLRDGGDLPATSQPIPAWFGEAYADADDSGCSSILSLHLSARLSGTVDRARVEAGRARLPVRVVDSRTVSGGLALGVLAAQRAAAAGHDLATVADVAERTCAASRTMVALDTVDLLRRGGRVGSAQAFVGSVLRVRPLLTIADGEVAPLDKVRTWSRALDRLAEAVEVHAGDRPCDVVIVHALAPERAAALAEAVRARVEVASELVSIIGPIVGAHSGEGAVGVAVAPRLEPT